jgi:hypothetical protein
MTRSAWGWVWFGFLLALDIAIPWYGLPLIEEWRGESLGVSGAFLFWTIWAAVAIISAFVILLKWRGVER